MFSAAQPRDDSFRGETTRGINPLHSGGIYRTIVADPPWDYGRDAERWLPSQTGGDLSGPRASIPYSALSVEEIAAIPVASVAAKNARLFLWTTNKHLPDALTVLRAWGFAYRQTIVWRKLDPPPWGGSVAPNSAEFLLVCTKGSPEVLARWPESVISAAKASHSQKPEVFLDLAEHTTLGPRLELFSRRARLGWDTWGDEALHGTEVVA